MNKFIRHLWLYFITGLIVVFAFAVIAFVFKQLITWMDLLVPFALNINIPKLLVSLSAFILLIFLIGIIARKYLEKKALDIGNAVIINVPILNKAFVTIQQIISAILKKQNSFSGEVIAIEYPKQGMWSLGFITSRETLEISSAVKESVVCCYIPSTPNPASGVTVYLPEYDVVKVDISPELVLKASVSGGFICSLKSDNMKAGSQTLGEFLSQKNIQSILKKAIGDPRD